MKPKFDPSQDFEVIETPKKGPKKPKFDPSKDFEILSGSEVDPREVNSEIANLELQKDVADYTKDMAILAGHGASQGFSDEAIAGLKTGSISSPEYVTERDALREDMASRKERMGIPGIVSEATGSVASTAAVPIMKSAPVLKELFSAGLQGAGEAREMQDIPREAAKSAAIQGAAEVGGKVVKNMFFDDPTKILTRSVGVRSGDLKGDTGSRVIQATERLNKAGFFKQGGDVHIPNNAHVFKRNAKNLTEFLKPMTDSTLYKRATDTISTLSDRNKALLKGKMVPSTEFKRALYEGVQELTYEPKGFNVEKRLDLARDLVDTVEKDLRAKTGWSGGGPIPAEDVELAKQSLDAYMRDPTFDKRLLDLGIDKQGMMKFRTKLDDVLDSHKVGGAEYKKNNDMISDLITVRDTLEAKEAKSYVDSGSRMINVNNWWESAKEMASPTSVDILRSDISKGVETPIGSAASKIIKRAPVERFTGREPQSTMITPKQMINYKIPRTTQGILENKEMVMGKLIQNNVPQELVETIAQALDNDHEAVANIAPLVIQQFPTIFERSKYQVFDGIIAATDRAKAADAIAKREDMNSIQRAKAIDGINKSGKFPQELD